MSIDRRTVLHAGATTALAGTLTGTFTGLLGGIGARPAFAVDLREYPFTLGVASGDPRADGVTLWTRLAPDPLVPGYGMPGEDFSVGWQVATDEAMANVVKAGARRVTAAEAHAVHVDVRGLEPDRHYWYRFRVGRHTSPIGRTRTFPAAGAAVRSLRFATLSCQNYPTGYWSALRHLAGQDLDVVLHLGDYIYEGAGANPVAGPERAHAPAKKIITLEDFRIRHAQYKLDPDLQAVHAAHPFIAVPDDHEVTNNLHSETDPALQSNGFQAYWEHLPLPASSRPSGNAIQLFRSLNYGSLATFDMLDTRQYRTPQLGGPTFQPLRPEAYDPARTLVGAEQERWLFDRLNRSEATWNLLAQQIYLAALDMAPGDGERYNTDKWDGYPVARERLTRFLHEAAPRNPVVLAGDVHAAMVNDITLSHDTDSPVVASEFLGSSVSSLKGNNALFEAAQADNPEMLYYNGRQRGYLLCEATPERFRGDQWFVDDALVPDSPVRQLASYAVDAGRLGAYQV